MHRFRFSVLTLLVVVTVCALASAAFLRPTELWATIISAILVGYIFYAFLATFFSRDASRAYWGGFLAIALAYLCLDWASIPFLATTMLSSQLEAHNPEFLAVIRAGKTDEIRALMAAFEHISRCSWSLILGFAGGLAARHLYIVGGGQKQGHYGGQE